MDKDFGLIHALGKVDRTLTMEGTISVAHMSASGLAPDDEVPAFNDGQRVFINFDHNSVPGKDPRSRLMHLLGVNYHELAHLMFTPRGGTQKREKLVPFPGQRIAFNILEDGRIERLLIAMYPSTEKYLLNTTLNITGLTFNQSVQNIMKSYPILVVRQSYLPASIIDTAIEGFRATDERKYLRIVTAMKRVSRRYSRLSFKDDDEVTLGAKLIEEFNNLLMKLRQAGIDPQSSMEKGEEHTQHRDPGSSVSPSAQERMQKTADRQEKERREEEAEEAAERDSAGQSDPDGEDDAEDEFGDASDDPADEDNDESDEDSDGSGSGDADEDGEADEGGSGDSDSDSDADGDSDGEGTGDGDGDSDADGEGDSETEGTTDSSGKGHGAGKGMDPPMSRPDVTDQMGEILDEIAEDLANDSTLQSELDKHENAVRHGQGFSHSDKPVPPYMYLPVDGAQKQAARKMANELQALQQTYDPGWERRTNTGRINVMRHAMGADLDESFDQWREDRADAVGIEFVLLIDMSSSMGVAGKYNKTDFTTSEAWTCAAGQASRMAWVLRKAIQEVGGTTTMIGFEFDRHLLTERGHKAQPNRFEFWVPSGGTFLRTALEESSHIMRRSKSNTKLVVVVTDGDFTDSEEDLEHELAFLHGDRTVVAKYLIESAFSSRNRYDRLFDEVGRVANPMDVIPLTKRVIKRLIKQSGERH